MEAYARAVNPVTQRRPESLGRINVSARKLFVERGYHETRPQDIAREAGLGHGTFYLHYADKRECFLAFVEEARTEIHEYLRQHVSRCETVEEMISFTLRALYDYDDANPGVLQAAMVDEGLIGMEAGNSLPERLGEDWTNFIRERVRNGSISTCFPAEIVGSAIAGAIHFCRVTGDRLGLSRQQVIENLPAFLAAALKA